MHWSSAHPESASLTLSEQRHAYINTCCTVEVVPFLDTPAIKKASSSASSSSAATTTTASKLHTIAQHPKTLVLDAESCGDVHLDATGQILAMTLLATHAIVVWDLGGAQQQQPRYVPLGSIAEVPEKVHCGGPKSSVVVATCANKVVCWNWREPEGSAARGPHWLWGSGGPITALAIDGDDAPEPSSSSSGGFCCCFSSSTSTSVFACARETRRSVVLEFNLKAHELERTLIGITDYACDTHAPIPATACAVASCSTHVSVSTTIGELVVWERASGGVAFRLHDLLPEPQQKIAAAAAASATSPKDAVAAVAAAASAASRAAEGRIVYAACLAFIPGALVCGLSSGDVVAFGLETHTTLVRLCGRGELLTSLYCAIISPAEEESALVLRLGFARGTIITRRFPVLKGVAAKSTSSIAAKKKKKKKKERACSLCGKRTSEYGHCGRCWKETYCSRECQKKDWRRHKLVCEPREIQKFLDAPSRF